MKFHSAFRLLFACSFLFLAVGCPDGGGDDADVAKQITFDFTITGETLDAPVKIKVSTDNFSYHYYKSTGDLSMTGFWLQDPLVDGNASINNAVISLNAGEAGEVSLKDDDIDIVVGGLNTFYEGKPTTVSLRPHDGETVRVTAVSEQAATIEIDADFSPTQSGHTDLTFHVKGSIKAKK